MPSSWKRPHLRLPRWTPQAVVLFVAVYLGAHALAKTAISVAGSRLLGTRVRVGWCTIGVLHPGVTLHHLVVEQPKGFPRGHLLDVPTLSARLTLGGALRGQWHFADVVVDVREFRLVKDKDGRLNVDTLAVIAESKPASAAMDKTAKPASAALPAAMPPFTVDRMRLSVERVIFTDYQKGSPPEVQVYEHVLRGKTYKHITAVRQLVVVVLMQAMSPTAVKSAGISAAAALSGAALLPVAVLGVMAAKDDATAELSHGARETLRKMEAFLKDIGKVTRSDRDRGELWGKARGCDVYVHVESLGFGRSRVTITARKLLLPQPAVAAGLLYQLRERL